MMSETTMAVLAAGMTIRHRRWGTTGTVRVDGDLVHVKWDGHFTDDEISGEGPVLPEDLEITGSAS